MFLCARVSGKTDYSDALGQSSWANNFPMSTANVMDDNEKHCLAKLVRLNAKHVAASPSTRANDDSTAKHSRHPG